MPDASDTELLQDYIRQGSEGAFAMLVQRHINLVYSVAFRHVGIAAHAEEITQAVFIILARKAANLRADTILEGWLHETTRLTALSFMRGERRRQFREQEAYMQSTLQEPTPDSAWNQLAPLLDEAMSRLGRKERDAVMLRFFKEKSLREVAAALMINEAAAQKRVLRALEKLRTFFTKRGVALTTTIIAGAVSANSVQAAPAVLAKSITAVAIAKGVTASASTLTLIKGALKLMAWAKMKTAALTGAAIILAAGTATVAVKTIAATQTQPDIEGTWMTTLELAGWGVHAGERPKTRVVFRVTKKDGLYQASGDSIDQGLKNLPASKFVYDYPSIHVEVDAVGYTFDGKLNSDTTEFSGSWKQGTDSGQLVFKRTANPPAFPEPVADDDCVPRASSDLQGFWKGMIGTGASALRVSAKIAELSAGKYRADFFCDSQGGGRQPSTLSYDKPVVKLTTMAGFGMFEGQLRSNGTELVGNWIQGGQQTPTFFKRMDSGPDGGGIGAALRFDQPTGTIRIGGIVPDSPASEAGLSVGMIVQKVDDVPAKGKNLADCVNLIRGPVGTKVRLELITPDGGKTNMVELTRQKIKL